jgi:negative regulator of replication initiation
LTPAVISVAEVVIKFIAGQALKLGEQAAGAIVESKIKSVLASSQPATPAGSAAPAALTAEQLAEVRKVAINRAVSLQLPHEQAERLADAMVARLATHP